MMIIDCSEVMQTLSPIFSKLQTGGNYSLKL